MKITLNDGREVKLNGTNVKKHVTKILELTDELSTSKILTPFQKKRILAIEIEAKVLRKILRLLHEG